MRDGQRERAAPHVRRFLISALPFTATALILFLLFRRVSPRAAAAALGSADLFRFFVGLFPISVLYVVLDTGVLAAVLRRFHPPGLSLRETWSVRAVD